MREVALAAGVSISAVSYVLNNTRPVSAEKRARVLQAMADLEYVPNGMARALRSTRSGLIGVVLADLANPSYGLIARGIETVTGEAGYLTIFCTSPRDDDARSSAYVRGLEGIRVEGLILRATRQHRELLPSVLSARAPAVLVMHDPPSSARHLDRVLLDNALGVQLAVRHLAEHGHQRIALVSSQDIARPTLVRLQGFLHGMDDAGLHADMSLVRIGPPADQIGEALTGEVLDVSPRPTALLVAHARQVPGAIRAIRRRGLRVPDDLSLIVSGDPAQFELHRPDLTMIVQPYEALGQAAARLLLGRLRGATDRSEPRVAVLEPTLQVGASVGPP
jgi:DNA-binding LacI/PurR family transcriptional regulator